MLHIPLRNLPLQALALLSQGPVLRGQLPQNLLAFRQSELKLRDLGLHGGSRESQPVVVSHRKSQLFGDQLVLGQVLLELSLVLVQLV